MGPVQTFVALLVALLLTAPLPAMAKKATSETILTQKEFAVYLIKALHWDSGLPKEPKDADYLAILDGKRSFRFEAEEIYDQQDNASVRTFSTYGPFSGKGWVSGISEPTEVHLRIFLPLEGTYALAAAVKGDGIKWSAGDKTFTVSAGSGLRDTEVGTVSLKAGSNDIIVTLPPDGAIDYVSLTAPSLRPLVPLSGWNFQAPLRRVEAAQVAVTLLGLENSFSADAGAKPIIVPVVDTVKLPAAVTTENVAYYGAFSAPQWVRAGYRSVPVDIPLKVEEEGLYRLKVQYLGNKLSAILDDLRLMADGRPFFYGLDLGVYPLQKGTHKLTVNLAPRDGVDVVRLERLKASPADFLAAAGIQGEPDAAVKKTESEPLINAITSRFQHRK